MEFEILFAQDTECPDQTVKDAYKMFQNIYWRTPGHLGNFLSMAEQDFATNKTIVARPTGTKNVCGVILSDKDPAFTNPLFIKHDVKNRLLSALHLENFNGISRLSSIAVDEPYRQNGIAKGLYKFASQDSQNRCIGLMLKENKIGDLSAQKSGFHDIPSLDFIQNYRRDGKKIVMDDQGDLTCRWQMITTLEIS